MIRSEALRQALEADGRIRLAILYGSMAKGIARAESDADLAIAFRSYLTLDDRLDLSVALESVAGCSVDVVDLRAVEGVLLQEILDHRMVLVNREPDLIGQLISKRVTEATDLMPHLERIWKVRRERFLS